MEIDTADRLSRLSAALYPASTHPSKLPVYGYRPASGQWKPRPAAVLVPIRTGPEPDIILTVRSETLAHHAGQVAFPGGGRSCRGESPAQTAIRETTEEIGIPGSEIRVLGMMDRYDTISAYRMVPVVGLVAPDVEMHPDPAEVSRIFTVPLGIALDRHRYAEHRVRHESRTHRLLALEHPDHLVWGATAAVLHHFACRVAEQGN